MLKEDTKRMAKNTVFLYLRSLITLIISLYSSRIILQALGVDNYGLYQIVGGVVGTLAFLQISLNKVGVRFLTYEMGRNDEQALKHTFNTLITIYFIFIFLIVVAAESIGLWFIIHKAGIDPAVLDIAVIAYHFSILTAVFTIIQVPFVSLMIAREEMNVYASIGIFWSVCRLIVAFIVSYFTSDNLVLYAKLLCLTQFLITCFAIAYSYVRFPESRFRLFIHKEHFKKIATYGSWNTIISVAQVSDMQGINIITNIFFNPATVASRAISVRVNAAVTTLYESFRNAIRPQIIKRYAKGDHDGSRNLLLITSRYSFFIVFLMGLPIILLAEQVLQLWLGQVPEYSVIFLQLVMVESFMRIFDGSFSIALSAKGQNKESSTFGSAVIIIKFGIVYLLFKNGYSPVALSYAGIISFFILSWIVKPILLCRICHYKISDFVRLFMKCVQTVLIPVVVALILAHYISFDSLLNCFIVLVLITLVNCVCFYFIGVDKEHRTMVIDIFRKKTIDS